MTILAKKITKIGHSGPKIWHFFILSNGKQFSPRVFSWLLNIFTPNSHFNTFVVIVEPVNTCETTIMAKKSHSTNHITKLLINAVV